MSKKQKCPAFENHERWIVSFADMMTLLFALFVVLFALKEGSNSPEIDQAAGAIQESFNDVLEDIPVDRRIGPDETGFGIFEHLQGNTPRPQMLPKYPSSTQQRKVIDEELLRVKKELELRLYGPGKAPDIKDPGQQRVVNVTASDEGINLTLAATHFYESGGYRMRKQALKELDVIAGLLKDLGRKVTIEGHTDSIPSASELGNWELSSLRAAYVAKHFMGNHNFSPNQIIVAGYADTKPIAHNTTAEGRQLNRRIELKIHYDD